MLCPPTALEPTATGCDVLDDCERALRRSARPPNLRDGRTPQAAELERRRCGPSPVTCITFAKPLILINVGYVTGGS